MKKERIAMIISLLLIVMTYVCILTGCKAEKSPEYDSNTEYMRIISDEAWGKIIYDTRTGVEYWYSYSGYGYDNGHLTVLVDKNGKPLIYERSEGE